MCLINYFYKQFFSYVFICLDGGIDNGLFLVRDSSTAVGDFVLSVLQSNEVVHYQIRRHGEDAFYSLGQ